MYHKLFDSSFPVTIGKIPLIVLLADASLHCLAIPSKHLPHFFCFFCGKRNPNPCRAKPADILIMVHQGKGADIVNHIIAVLALISHRAF